MTAQIDLNADLGEGAAYDAELMSVITSCNIACGGHAGDPESMREALTLARDHRVSAGAHPSFPDRENFGRTRSSLSGDALEASLTNQINSLRELADEMQIPLTHLKPHGALYNMAAQDVSLSNSIINALKQTIPHARLIGPPDSELERQAKMHGVPFVAEGFADRAYETDGQLRDRQHADATIHGSVAQAKQALVMATNRQVKTHSGAIISLPVQTICVHGDTPDAFYAAQSIRTELERAGIRLCAPS